MQLDRLVESKIQFPDYVSGRFGCGHRELPAAAGYSRSTILLWLPESHHARIIELTCKNGSIPKYHVAADHHDWQKLRVLQLFGADQSAMDVAEQQESSGSQRVETVPESTALEPIPEGVEEEEDAGGEDSVAST